MKTEWVLVEAVNMTRMRYVIEVPEGKKDYALDTVVMEEAKEFSQQHIDEVIVSHRPIQYNEALKLCNKDNNYALGWSTKNKEKAFFTRISDYDGDI